MQGKLLTVEDVTQIVTDYLQVFPDEHSNAARLLKQLADNEKMNDRMNFRGHITASGVVLSPDKTKILLIHHKGSGNWQQPGGHWESDDEPDPLAAAKREVIEETAVQLESYLELVANKPLIPFDIDTHWIATPRHAAERPHYHHDFLYVFIAKNEIIQHQPEEVYDAAWFLPAAKECNSEKMQRVLQKLRVRHNIG